MKLGEALAERAEATRRVEQLRARVVSSARHQEGETPAEEASQLLAEAGEVLDTTTALAAVMLVLSLDTFTRPDLTSWSFWAVLVAAVVLGHYTVTQWRAYLASR